MGKWHVYEFCKAHQGILLHLSHRGRLKYLREHLQDVKLSSLHDGLLEFEAIPAHNWTNSVEKVAN